MITPCPGCHRRFGGHETFSRHHLAREDRCRTEGELKVIGIQADASGVYRRVGSRTKDGQSRLFDRRTVGIRRHRPISTETRRDAQSASSHVGDTSEAHKAAGGRG